MRAYSPALPPRHAVIEEVIKLEVGDYNATRDHAAIRASTISLDLATQPAKLSLKKEDVAIQCVGIFCARDGAVAWLRTFIGDI